MVAVQNDFNSVYIANIKQVTIPISEIANTRGKRIDASVYCTEGRKTRQLIQKYEGETKPLAGTDGFVSAYHRPRFKRVFVKISNLPIFQPSQICDVYPKPELFISDKTETKIDQLRVHKGQILVTCSGTIGKVSFVSSTLDNQIFSHDLLRLDPIDQKNAGYIFAFLSSNYGQALLTTNNYGAVVQHIEPSHLTDIQIPNPPEDKKNKISDLIVQSFTLRDESNKLIDEAEQLFINTLQLPPINELKQKTFSDSKNVIAYTISASNLHNRFDGSYHVPIVDSIVGHISKYAKEVIELGSDKLTRKILLPGRFKRVYVDVNNGIPFFGGKQIYELAPSGMKYLSKTHHTDRFNEQLELKENMVLVTCSGTIGKVTIAPKHWQGWAANQHILRILPISENVAGYIFAWLDTEYGQALIRKHTYGAVVDEIDDQQLSTVPIPLVNENIRQQINDLILTANKKRYEAYLLEKEAVLTVNKEVMNH